MDILQVLKQEHKEVASMLKKLEKTTGRAKKSREQLFSKLNHSLTLHADFEEKFFYPQLKRSAKAKDLVLEAYEEHHVVKFLLSELENLSVIDETWQAKLTVLKENVSHHVKEEEKGLFPKAKTLLGSSKLKALAAQYQEFKEKSNGS